MMHHARMTNFITMLNFEDTTLIQHTAFARIL